MISQIKNAGSEGAELLKMDCIIIPCSYHATTWYDTTEFAFYTVNPEIFARILFSRIALKDIFVTLKIRDYGMIYIISNNDRVISAFREDFIFTKLRNFAKIKPSRKFQNLQYA